MACIMLVITNVTVPSFSADTVQYFDGGIVAQSVLCSMALNFWQKSTIAAKITHFSECALTHVLIDGSYLHF